MDDWKLDAVTMMRADLENDHLLEPIRVVAENGGKMALDELADEVGDAPVQELVERNVLMKTGHSGRWWVEAQANRGNWKCPERMVQ